MNFEPRLQPLEFEFTSNTEPNKERLFIPSELIRQWGQSPEDPFPDYDGIMAYAKADPEVRTALNGYVKGREWERVSSVHPWASNSEIMVELNIKTHFDVANLALVKSARRGNMIIIQGGESAGAMEEGGSEPDGASFRLPAEPTRNL